MEKPVIARRKLVVQKPVAWDMQTLSIKWATITYKYDVIGTEGYSL